MEEHNIRQLLNMGIYMQGRNQNFAKGGRLKMKNFCDAIVMT